MHKDVAKRPGRHAQKRHATFTVQAANRLVDKYVIDFAYNALIVPQLQQQEKETETEWLATTSGSRFNIKIIEEHINDEETRYKYRLQGSGVLSRPNLSHFLYPNLVEFIVAHFTQYDKMPANSHVCLRVL